MAATRAGLRRITLGVCMLAFFSAPSFAQKPPAPDCRRASKIEYDSAKRYHLLRNKFGAYVRTGHFWRRYYWYCRG
jgi:hypothetical protein